MEKRKDLSQRILKSRWTWLVAGLLFVLGIGYGMGNTNAAVPLGDKKFTYEEIEKEIATKESELAAIITEIEAKEDELEATNSKNDDVLDEIKENQAKFDEAMEISEKKKDLLAEIKKAEGQLSSKKEELSSLDSQISSKNDDLAKVDQLIKEKEEEPVQLSAGTFIVGQDFPPGRYKAQPVGRGSNFAVYSDTGDLEVNTILGSNGEAEYIFYAFDGYVIESRSTASLTPVE